jgi:hypothetical protein
LVATIVDAFSLAILADERGHQGSAVSHAHWYAADRNAIPLTELEVFQVFHRTQIDNTASVLAQFEQGNAVFEFSAADPYFFQPHDFTTRGDEVTLSRAGGFGLWGIASHGRPHLLALL